VVRFYINLKDPGDCQTRRKSYNTSHIVGVQLVEKSTDSAVAPEIDSLSPFSGRPG